MRAGERLQTTIQISSGLSRAELEETTGVSAPASLGLNTDEPAQIQPRVTRKAKSVAWTMQKGCRLSTAHSHDYTGSCI